MEKLISEISSGITSAKELKKQIQKIDITNTWREEKYFAKVDSEHEKKSGTSLKFSRDPDSPKQRDTE